MKKAFAIVAFVFAATVGCVLAYIKLPSYRGPTEPLTDAQKQLVERLRKHIDKLAGEIGERNLMNEPGSLEKAAMYIEQQFTESGLTPTRQTFSVSGYFNDGMFGATHATQSASNIVAEIPGNTRASEIVVLGAHYDSAAGCPAANDNGSGVAAILEIARALAKEKFARTIRFVAFTNEEPPIFGSEDMGSFHYAKQCKERGDNIVAMLSVETIAYYTNKPNSQNFPLSALAMVYPATGDFIAFVGNLDNRSLLNRCATIFNTAVKFPSEVLCAPTSIPGVDYSDHLNFWKMGYPGIMVTDTANYRYADYHLKTDTPDKLNYDDFARVTYGLQQVARDLASKNDI